MELREGCLKSTLSMAPKYQVQLGRGDRIKMLLLSKYIDSQMYERPKMFQAKSVDTSYCSQAIALRRSPMVFICFTPQSNVCFRIVHQIIFNIILHTRYMLEFRSWKRSPLQNTLGPETSISRRRLVRPGTPTLIHPKTLDPEPLNPPKP